MDDSIQAFVDQLRSLLQAPDPAQTAELVLALARFGAYCEESNRRLRECLALISKGQYANAVELAEREPNLLDRCSLLDIPERDMLPTVARSVSAPTPAVIGRELVEALQEAYQKGSTAAGNRRLLHKLALARAPLPARLAVMRRLAIQDPNHPFLDTDIRNFERAWFKQAPAVAQRAANEGNAALVEELVDDLQNGGYLETPPAAMMAPLQKSLWKARTAMLPALAEAIHSAFRDNAFAKLKELAAQWSIFAVGIPDAADRFHVADALDWFWKECDRQKHAEERNAAQARLSRLMESPDVERADLDSAYQSAVSLGEFDAGLEAQYRSLVQRMERRRMAILAGKVAIAFALVATPVIALIVWAMHNAAHRRDVEALTTELTRLIQPEDPKNVWKATSEDLEQTLKIVTNSKASVARDEKIIALREIAQSEIDRRQQLERALVQIHDCPLGKDVGPLVAAARHHQKTEAEEQRIGEAETEWKERSAKQIAAFKQRADDLLKRSNDVAETAKRGQVVAGDDPIPGLRRDLESLQADARRMEHDDSRLQAISDNLGSMDNWKKFAGPVQDFERTMRGAKLSPEALQRIAVHLKETIANHCPNRAAKANAVLAQDSIDMWNRLRELGATLNQAGADASSVDWSKLVTEWKETPLSALLEAKGRYAEMLRQRNPDSQATASSKLRELLNQKGVAKVWMLHREQAPETRYYFSSEPAVNKQANFKTFALVGPTGVTREVILPQKNYKKPVLSPQSVVAKDILEIWKSKNQDSWNKSLADVFETLCRSKASEAMDPLIKLRLVHDFLLLAAESSLGFRKKLEGLPAYNKLTANEMQSLTAGNWLDPREDDRLKSQRAKAAQLVGEAPDLMSLLPDADEFDRRLADLAGQKDSAAWIGWLAPGERSPVAVVPFANRGNLRPGKIYVVVNAKYIAIGNVAGDKETLDELAVEYLGYPALAVSDVMVK